MKTILKSPIVAPFTALMFVTAIVAITTPRFVDAGNLSNLALQVSIVAIVAIGSTFVIFTGGIDLSPGSMIALLTMLFATMVKGIGLPLPIAIVATIISGAVLGGVNGTLTAYLRIPAFITTLAALSAFRGMAFMFNNGSPIFSLHPSLESIFYGRVAGLPLPLYYLIVLYGIAWFTLRYTKFGRAVYAVGGNPNAAKLSGINVKRIQFLAFVAAGGAAGIGALLMAARLNSGSPNYGVGLELSAIAAAVIGGASLAGGRGNIVNTLIGALTIVIVQNGLNLNAVPTSAQTIVIGVIIILAVGIDMWRNELGQTLQKLAGIHRN